MTTAKPGIRVFNADTYASGDPATFGLPLNQYAYLRDEEPCYLYEFDDPMLIDRAWVVSSNADIWAAAGGTASRAADSSWGRCRQCGQRGPAVARRVAYDASVRDTKRAASVLRWRSRVPYEGGSDS